MPVFPLVLTLAIAGWLGDPQTSKSPASNSFESVNVCERVPVTDLAAAVGGKALDARALNTKGFVAARCVYGVEIAGARQAFVLWFSPAADYDGLRKEATGPVKPVAGLGDAGHLTIDPDTKRHMLTVVKRGQVTLQITGAEVDWLEKIAKLALSKFAQP